MSDYTRSPDSADVPAKDYEATFTVLMPSNQKSTVYKINVKASEPVEATARAIDAWKEATNPTDIQVKEIRKATK
jgi:predicted secreted hydrolase